VVVWPEVLLQLLAAGFDGPSRRLGCVAIKHVGIESHRGIWWRTRPRARCGGRDLTPMLRSPSTKILRRNIRTERAHGPEELRSDIWLAFNDF